MTLTATVSIAFFAWGPSLPAFQATGQIRGTVLADAGGAPIAGATVTALTIGAPAGATPTAKTAQDGSFTLSGLAPGRYGVCVQEPTSTLVDPCQWRDSLVTTAVAANAVSSVPAISLKAVSSLRVHLNDNGHYLQKTAADKTTPHIVVGAFDGKRLFHPAMTAQQGAGNVDYQLNIPCGSPLRLTVFSAEVQFEDVNHAPGPFQGNSEILLHQSCKAQPQILVFNVTGRSH